LCVQFVPPLQRDRDEVVSEWAVATITMEWCAHAAGWPVRRIHPYDDKWGVLLDRNLWATAPSE